MGDGFSDLWNRDFPAACEKLSLLSSIFITTPSRSHLRSVMEQAEVTRHAVSYSRTPGAYGPDTLRNYASRFEGDSAMRANCDDVALMLFPFSYEKRYEKLGRLLALMEGVDPNDISTLVQQTRHNEKTIRDVLASNQTAGLTGWCIEPATIEDLFTSTPLSEVYDFSRLL